MKNLFGKLFENDLICFIILKTFYLNFSIILKLVSRDASGQIDTSNKLFFF